MSHEMIALAMFAGMMLMLVTGQRVFAAIGFVAALAGVLLWGTGGVTIPFSAVMKLMQWYPLLTLPMFIFMGYVLSESRIADDLYRMFHVWMGPIRGGLAIGTIGLMVLISAMNGLSVAGMAIGATIALPELLRRGYDKVMVTGVIQAGSSLGILVPPSVVLVVYAILAEQNIAKLFAAAMVPGMLAAGLYVAAIALYVRLKPEHGPAQPRHSSAELLAAAKEVWPIAAIFIMVFGGIYGGFFTPTEGAAVGAGSTFLSAAARGEMGLQALKRSFLSTAETTGFVFMIFLGADMLNSALALSQMPMRIAEAVSGLEVAPVAIVACILLLYIALSSVMDELAMIILTVPILFPLVIELDLYGLNLTEKAIWFGILILSVVEIGLIAPPVGLNVYVVNGLAPDVPMSETYKGVALFLAADVVRVALLLAFPVLSLWLVRLIW
ncbi:MAG TPA: TRAP transporter large permease [Burkholderiales bacterium]